MILIDADMIYDILANKLTWLMNISDAVYLEVGNDIRQSIDELSTAYDIDEVVNKLKETSVTYCKEYGYAEDENVLYLPDAIEIMKGGAK